MQIVTSVTNTVAIFHWQTGLKYNPGYIGLVPHPFSGVTALSRIYQLLEKVWFLYNFDYVITIILITWAIKSWITLGCWV